MVLDSSHDGSGQDKIQVDGDFHIAISPLGLPPAGRVWSGHHMVSIAVHECLIYDNIFIRLIPTASFIAFISTYAFVSSSSHMLIAFSYFYSHVIARLIIYDTTRCIVYTSITLYPYSASEWIRCTLTMIHNLPCT